MGFGTKVLTQLADKVLMGVPKAIAMGAKAKMGLGNYLEKKIIEASLEKGMYNKENYNKDTSILQPVSTEGNPEFIPFVKTDQGYEGRLPGIAGDAYNAFIAPGRSITDPNFNAPEEAVNMGLNLMGGGTIFGKVPPGALAMGAIRKENAPQIPKEPKQLGMIADDVLAQGNKRIQEIGSLVPPVQKVTGIEQTPSMGINTDTPSWMRQAEDIKRRRAAGESITGKDFMFPGDPDLRAEAIIAHFGQVPSGERKMLDVANMLQEHSEKMLKGFDVTDVGIHSRRSAAETVDALMRAPENQAWYGKSILETQSQAALKHKELLTDRNALSRFNYALAVTSNGIAVDTNTGLAMRAYDTWKKTGKMPEDIGIGERSGPINDAMKFWNQSVEKFGEDNFIKFLNSDFTPAEMRSLGYTVDATGPNKVKGSAVLGPKIGAAFFQNLEGNFNPFTLDMWMRRNYGRGAKSVLETNPEVTRKAAMRFEESLNTDAGLARMEEILGESLEGVRGSPEMYNKIAARVFNKWGTTKSLDPKTGKMAGYPMTGIKEQDEAMRASRELAKSMLPVGDYTPAERNLQEKALYDAVNYMKAAGFDILPADMQALMWGHEQDLWRSLGSRTKETPDYSSGMKKLLEGENYGAKQLANARNRATTGKSAIGTSAGTFAPTEQRNWAADIISADVRAAISGNIRNNGGAGILTRRSGRTSRHNLSDGTQAVIQPKDIKTNYALPRKFTDKFKTHGLGAPAVQELKNTSDTLRVFQDASAQAQKLRGDIGYSVTVYSDPQQYKNKRNFLTEDGTAGFSLDGDNIVGVFNTKGGPHKFITPSMINMAVDAGGRRLDAFDILGNNGASGLPLLYSRAGFIPVTKLKFDPSFPPEGMSVDAWKAWGDKYGNPDLVFMKYDPNASGIFDTKGLKYSNSYEAAVKKQGK